MDPLEELRKDIESLKARNVRVETDKAWEQSATRVISIAGITYIVASLLLYFIGVPNFLLAALVPVVGYYLSTRSLRLIRRWFEHRQ